MLIIRSVTFRLCCFFLFITWFASKSLDIQRTTDLACVMGMRTFGNESLSFQSQMIEESNLNCCLKARFMSIKLLQDLDSKSFSIGASQPDAQNIFSSYSECTCQGRKTVQTPR